MLATVRKPISTTLTRSLTTEAPTTSHFKITLRRSAIALGEKKQKTLLSLGITRRFQTVYYPHTPEVAGKILLLKELLEVENVDREGVRTKQEQRGERKANRGYEVVGRRVGWDV